MKPYLCGPINGCTDAECNDWRTVILKEFPEAIDPMRRDYRGREHLPEVIREIVWGDKQDVEDCDVVVAFCPKPSVGTSMEIFYAHSLRTPVICIIPEGAPSSPWLVYHSKAVVKTLEEALSALRSLETQSAPA